MSVAAETIASATPRTEFELLCALAAADPSAGRIERIRNCDVSRLDWNHFLGQAEYHGLLPLVARNLLEHFRGVPAEIEGLLRAAYAANLRRSLWFSAELVRIIGHFARRNVPVVAHKGPALAQAAYGDVGLRSYSDLDLLICAQDFERARKALAEIGYSSSQEFAPAIERLWLRTGYERSFDSAAGKNILELQWALLPPFYSVDLPVEDLLARATNLTLGECRVPCLAAEDSLLAQAVHAAKHLWTRLIWLTDIAETLRSPDIDFSAVVDRARKLGIARIMGVNLLLAQHILGAPVPPALRELISKDREDEVVAMEIARRLVFDVTYDFESTDYFRLIMKLRERPSDRRQYLWRLIWTPGTNDVAAIRLPEGLFPLYRIVRIARLTWKLVMR